MKLEQATGSKKRIEKSGKGQGLPTVDQFPHESMSKDEASATVKQKLFMKALFRISKQHLKSSKRQTLHKIQKTSSVSEASIETGRSTVETGTTSLSAINTMPTEEMRSIGSSVMATIYSMTAASVEMVTKSVEKATQFADVAVLACNARGSVVSTTETSTAEDTKPDVSQFEVFTDGSVSVDEMEPSEPEELVEERVTKAIVTDISPKEPVVVDESSQEPSTKQQAAATPFNPPRVRLNPGSFDESYTTGAYDEAVLNQLMSQLEERETARQAGTLDMHMCATIVERAVGSLDCGDETDDKAMNITEETVESVEDDNEPLHNIKVTVEPSGDEESLDAAEEREQLVDDKAQSDDDNEGEDDIDGRIHALENALDSFNSDDDEEEEESDDEDDFEHETIRMVVEGAAVASDGASTVSPLPSLQSFLEDDYV